ncbi:ATP-binding cassette domain-containing protein [Sedimentitalea sp. XS_ASV28]|uniref:thiamine ABC transporter ATP-binding protein n=1 Tax=Sedimentitalea sp. XS_ASV28 TaxID=3241296 RepID=UPI0035187B1B
MLRLEKLVIDNGGFTLSADFAIEAGRKVAIIGPSGAGKSTLIGGIAGFHPVAAGRLIWDGKDLTDRPPGARPLAMLFQDGNLFPHLTIAQNVGLGLNPNLRLDRMQWRQVETAIAHVGLHGMGARKPAALSGGQQSRAALARVLIQDRPLLLLDEPFAALGPALKNEMLDLVDRLASETGATVLMVSHDPQDARRIADEIVLVADGIAHAPQSAAPLLDDPPPALRAYLG